MIWIDKDTLQSTPNIVYYIRNRYNDKMYIGQTERTFFERYPGGLWWKHSTNRFLKADYKKYGDSRFEVGVLQVVPASKPILEVETWYICFFRTIYPYGYNLTLDLTGHTNPDYAHVFVANVVARRCGLRISDEIVSKEELFRHIAATAPKAHKQRMREILSKANKGKVLSLEHRQAISRRHKGVRLSEEHVAKIRSLAIARQGKRVIQYSLGGERIAAFDSVGCASRTLGIGYSSITQCARGCSTRAGGFVWKYEAA
jgi:group I intron endonuclease